MFKILIMSESIVDFKKRFLGYEGSDTFINCAGVAFESIGAKEKVLKYFVSNHFQTNNSCDLVTMKKLAAHWNNIAFDNLQKGDFINYKYSLNTVANYRMIARIMEIVQTKSL